MQIILIQPISTRVVNSNNNNILYIINPRLTNHLHSELFFISKLLNYYIIEFKFNTIHYGDSLVTYCTAERHQLTCFFNYEATCFKGK